MFFLEEAFYNRFLTEEFGLDRLEAFLEVPLDSYVVKGMKNDPDMVHFQCNLPQWSKLKKLNPSQSDRFQDCAANLAAVKGISRVYLDLLYWRRPNRSERGPK